MFTQAGITSKVRATGANANPRLGMATVYYDGKKGTITADTTSMSLLIDDMSTVADSGVTTKYKAGLRGVGQINIAFNAKDGADADIVNYGIKMQATISVTQTGTDIHNETDCFRHYPYIFQTCLKPYVFK